VAWFQLIHFLTTQDDTYMNGAFQSTSAAEDLARAPRAREGNSTGVR